eukprot:1501929-Prorocentrum_lima.AAC.1
MTGRSEQYTREEASWRLYEHYSDAKRRWRHFTGRPTRKQRFHYRKWSTVQKAVPHTMCAGCSTYYDIEAGREHGAACMRSKGR